MINVEKRETMFNESRARATRMVECNKMDKNITSLVKSIKITFILGENIRFDIFFGRYFMYPFPSK